MFGPHDDTVQQQILPDKPGFVTLSYDEIHITQSLFLSPKPMNWAEGVSSMWGSSKHWWWERIHQPLKHLLSQCETAKFTLAMRPQLALFSYTGGAVTEPAQFIWLLLTSMEGWKIAKFGRSAFDPIMTISLDGDATRWAALYVLLMRKKLSSSDPLFKWLGGLCGLNLFTSDNGETMDFDWKHLFKRLCTLLCCTEGMAVNNIYMDKAILAAFLELLDFHDWSEETIHSLLNPHDAQDVPRAIKLLSLVVELRDLDNSEFKPAEAATHKAICLLAEVFESLLDPFINPTMDLGDQIQSLSKFAHLICSIFIKNGTSFMSNQLYGDLQAMVKNAMFTVACFLNLDPEMEVFICLLGDDVLEALFGRVRMIGGHSPNCNLYELRYRLSSVKNIDGIFCCHPEWERKPLMGQKAQRADMLRYQRAQNTSTTPPKTTLIPQENAKVPHNETLKERMNTTGKTDFEEAEQTTPTSLQSSISIDKDAN
ncbi:hypothetical protein V5O48_018521 [Marasmius crinis-equi]|uniref:Uncharacterized protein n=1 Tax=Marasmius crinis-equi TaxID=585013 RepID=A0ABR3EL29_9AGAR